MADTPRAGAFGLSEPPKPPDPPRESGLLGRTIGARYKIAEIVGGGAMGDVYRAEHTGLGTDVALKILRPGIASEPKFKERFYREAKAASRLDHPNSVRVLDYGQEPDGLVYLAMEFLPGRDLLAIVKTEFPLADERIVDILAQTLAAVSLAHQSGIVHRDLKPENIMIVAHEDDERRDMVKVCDFGIAKLVDARAYKSAEEITTALTVGNALIGTPEYMSPEQARGEPLDARSDLYSVGVILYQLLTQKLPFTAENAIGIAVKQITEDVPLPSKVRPGVNPRLEAICLRALRKDPAERYTTAKEMRADLRAALDGGPGRALSTPSAPHLVAARASFASAPTLNDAARNAAPTSRDGHGPSPFAVGGVGAEYPDATAVSGVPDPVVPIPRRDVDTYPRRGTASAQVHPPPGSSRRLLVVVAVVGLALGFGLVLFLRTPGSKQPLAEAHPVSTEPAPASSATGSSGRTTSPRPRGSARAPAHPSSLVPGPDPTASVAENLLPPPGGTLATLPPPAHPTPPAFPGTLPAPGTLPTPATPNAASTHRDAGAVTPLPPPAGVSSTASIHPPASAAPPSAPPPPATPTASAEYKPAKALVLLQPLVTDRVQHDVLERKMAELMPRLNECYRDALFIAGAPVGGNAEILMSVDAAGKVVSVVTAAQLPPFQRCASRLLGGLSVPSSAVDPGGGTAQQTLKLVP